MGARQADALLAAYVRQEWRFRKFAEFELVKLVGDLERPGTLQT